MRELSVAEQRCRADWRSVLCSDSQPLFARGEDSHLASSYDTRCQGDESPGRVSASSLLKRRYGQGAACPRCTSMHRAGGNCTARCTGIRVGRAAPHPSRAAHATELHREAREVNVMTGSPRAAGNRSGSEWLTVEEVC